MLSAAGRRFLGRNLGSLTMLQSTKTWSKHKNPSKWKNVSQRKDIYKNVATT